MEDFLQKLNEIATNKKKATDLFSQYINGELPFTPSAVFHGMDGSTFVNKELYLKMISEKLWDDIACYANYADISKFEFMLPKLPLLADQYLYKGYQQYVGSMKSDAKDFSEFKTNCQKLLHLRKDRNMYLSVFSYVLATIPAAKPMIETLFKRYEDTLLRHLSSEYASRDLVKYNLNVQEFYYYRMTLVLCMEAESDPGITVQIRDVLKKTMPNIKEYVDAMGQYLEDGDHADGFFGPFLFIFKKIYVIHGNVDLILRLILSIYELCQDNGYKVHDEEPMFVAGLFFAINSNGGNTASTAANIIISKCKDALKSISGMRYENEFTSFLDMAAFLSNWAGIFTSRDTNTIIDRLKLLPKKKVKNIVENFIVSKYILVDTDYGGYKNCTDYVEKNMVPMLCFFQSMYSGWHANYSYMKETPFTCFDDDMDTDTVEAGIEEMSLFLNLFIDHVRQELYLSDLVQQDYSFSDEEQERKKEEESIYKQKCIDLEKECRELRSTDTNTKALMAENAELKKKIAELSHQTSQHTDEREKDKKELVGLRNLVHELSRDLKPEEIQSKTSIEEMGEYLNKNVRGVIIGGHVNVHNKLDKYIPKWKKYAPETKITLNTLKNNDIVVMFSDYLNHSSYFGAIDCVRESDCKLLYVHNVNMEYVMSQIYNACKEDMP